MAVTIPVPTNIDQQKSGDLVFFTSARLSEMWGYVFSLVKLASPGTLIAIALLIAGMLIVLIVYVVKRSTRDPEGSRGSQKDDDYDIKYY